MATFPSLGRARDAAALRDASYAFESTTSQINPKNFLKFISKGQNWPKNEIVYTNLFTYPTANYESSCPHWAFQSGIGVHLHASYIRLDRSQGRWKYSQESSEKCLMRRSIGRINTRIKSAQKFPMRFSNNMAWIILPFQHREIVGQNLWWGHDSLFVLLPRGPSCLHFLRIYISEFK